MLDKEPSMEALTLVSTNERPIKLLVESALTNEARLLEAAIHQTEGRIRNFEEKYDLSTADFLQRFAQNEFQHTFDFDDWIGESRMLARLREKLETVRGIKIAN
jgi:hypothetical protein